MKNLLKRLFSKIGNGLLFGVGIILSIGIFFIVYAAGFIPMTQVGTGSGLTATAWNQMISNLNDLDGRLTTLSTTSVPSGAIMAFNLINCPNGWIKANGTNGTIDLRGEFIRGFDDGRGVDSGRVLGSSQNATRVFHTQYDEVGYNGRQLDISGYISADYDGISELAITRASYPSLAVGGTISNSKGYGIRVRPRNVALLYCVKQ